MLPALQDNAIQTVAGESSGRRLAILAFQDLLDLPKGQIDLRCCCESQPLLWRRSPRPVPADAR
ncbi:MAG: hypothetical protein ACKPJD_39190, partial [Planctomycetaceae bacterium]